MTASENGNDNITHDSDALQYFALEAWAYDIAVPGVGCPGPALEDLPMTESLAAETSMMETSTLMLSETASTTAEAEEVSLHDSIEVIFC